MWHNPNAVTIAATCLFVLLWISARNAERLSRMIYGGLIFCFILVTLIFHPNFQNIVIGKDIVAQVMGFSLFLLWTSHLARPNGFVFIPTPMNIAVLVYFLCGVASAFLAPRWTWYYTLEEIVRNAAVVVMFFMVVKFMNTRRRWNLCLYTLLALMALTSFYGILQVTGFDFVSWGRIVNVSTFGNKDFFASFLTYTLPIAALIAIGSPNRFDAGLYLSAAALALYNIVQGETRGAWIGLMVLSAVTVWFELKHGRLRERMGTVRKKLVFGVAALAACALIVSATPKHKFETFKSIFQADRGTNLIRVYIWWASARMWADAPLMGQGIGTFQLTYPYFRPDRYHRIGMSHNTRHAHSEELEILAEQGLTGFSAWAAVLVVFFYLSFKKLKQIESRPERYIFYGVISGVLAGVVHDSINVNLRWTSSAIVLWFLLGLGTRYLIGFDRESDTARKRTARRANPDPAGPLKDRPWAEIPIGIVLAAAFAFMFRLEYLVIRADYLLHTVEGTVENPATARIGIETGQEVLRLVPYDHSAMYKMAYAYLNQNRIDDAREKYRSLMSLAPNYAQIHQNMALIAYRDYLTSRQKKHLYQSILEFEWATRLENNLINHSKMLQLYAQAADDMDRARYHNRYLFWNAQDDTFFKLAHYWRAVSPAMPARDREYAYNEWIKPMSDFSRDHWLYRMDFTHRLGRTREEARYVMKMAAGFVPGNADVMRISLIALSNLSDEPEEDLVYLIRLLDGLNDRAAQTVSEQLGQARQALESSADPTPLRLAALGILSHKLGDRAAAKNYFDAAIKAGAAKSPAIRDSLKRYGV